MSTEPKLKCKHGEGSDCATCAFLDDPRVDPGMSALARERDSWKDLYSKERADYQILLTELDTLRAQLRASREALGAARNHIREHDDHTGDCALSMSDGDQECDCDYGFTLSRIDVALQSTPQLAKNEGEKPSTTAHIQD